MKNIIAVVGTTKCPICGEAVDKLNNHLRLLHKGKEIAVAIIADKSKGLSDAEIGRKYWITYRQLEKIIREATGVSVSFIKAEKKIKTLYPKDFKEEATTVWSFKSRGNWATHSGEYIIMKQHEVVIKVMEENGSIGLYIIPYGPTLTWQ